MYLVYADKSNIDECCETVPEVKGAVNVLRYEPVVKKNTENKVIVARNVLSRLDSLHGD